MHSKPINIVLLLLLAGCQSLPTTDSDSKFPIATCNCNDGKTGGIPSPAKSQTSLDLVSSEFVTQAIRTQLLRFESAVNVEPDLKNRVIAAQAIDTTGYLKAASELESLLPKAKTNDVYQAIQGMRSVYLGQVMQAFQIGLSKLKFKTENSPFNINAQADELRTLYPHKIYLDQILQVTGAASEPVRQDTGSPVDRTKNTVPQTPTFEDAKLALDSNNPEDSLRILDSLEEKSERTARLRTRASDSHVKWIRTRVRDLYTSTQSQTDNAIKKKTLLECVSLLENLILKYPNHDGRPSVERNLKSIKRDLKDL